MSVCYYFLNLLTILFKPIAKSLGNGKFRSYSFKTDFDEIRTLELHPEATHHAQFSILPQQHLCQKLPKSVDVRWSYSVEHQCRFLRHSVCIWMYVCIFVIKLVQATKNC